MPKLKGSKDKRASENNEVNNAAKTLLANIRFMDVDHPVKTIVITSAIPNEGKSYVSQILSEAIATSGKTVLLLEGDLRRRTMAGRLGIHTRRGIYSILSGEAVAEDVIVPLPTDNMYFLDAEPNIPNPSDLFASRRFSKLLAGLAQAYDYVIIDTPPVNAFVDAAVLSYLADATFLVVRENYTHRDQVRNAVDQLSKTGGKVSGVVMNYCKSQSNDYYYSYYYRSEDADKQPELAAENAADSSSAKVPKVPKITDVPEPTKPKVTKLPSVNAPKFTTTSHGSHVAGTAKPASDTTSAPGSASGANPYIRDAGSSVGFTPASQGIMGKNANRRH